MASTFNISPILTQPYRKSPWLNLLTWTFLAVQAEIDARDEMAIFPGDFWKMAMMEKLQSVGNGLEEALVNGEKVFTVPE